MSQSKSIEVPEWLLERIHKSYEVFLYDYDETLIYEMSDINTQDHFADWSVRYYYNNHDDIKLDIFYTKLNVVIKEFKFRDTNDENYSLDEFKKYFRLKKKYILCSSCSSSEALFNELCRNCYLYSYDNPEPCCICYETFGRWARYKCGHILHEQCINKMQDNRCPMCRENLGYSRTPYFGKD